MYVHKKIIINLEGVAVDSHLGSKVKQCETGAKNLNFGPYVRDFPTPLSNNIWIEGASDFLS